MRIMTRQNNPGRLNKRVELLRLASADNRAGGRRSDSVRWDTFARCWAEITHVSGRERFENNQLEAELTHRMTIRYRKDLTRVDKVRYDGRLFNIQYLVNWRESNRFLVLYVKEEV